MTLIAPGSTIGIIGGGQLGRMTALAAARLGYRCLVLTPEADAPASQVTANSIVAPYDDPRALDEFMARADVVTIEFENVPRAVLEQTARRRPTRPSAAALAVAQDRLVEKDFLSRTDIVCTPYRKVDSVEELAQARAALGPDALLKTRRFGYDGKGQVGLDEVDDEAAALAQLAHAPAILEARVAFAMELSVVCARGVNGAVRSYPTVMNEHEDGILRRTTAPAPIAASVDAQARLIAERMVRALDYVGVLAVEMFLTGERTLLVNELAPRPHNSGHWTIDASPTSQFEQHVRAVCGLPLGPVEPFRAAIMDNLLGPAVEAWQQLVARPDTRLHLYGKSEVREGRKMGHVTRLLDAGGAALRR